MNKDFAARVFSFIGGLGGLLSITLIIWKGGVLWQMVNEHDRRINYIEAGGSVGLREHVKLDDERVNELKAQMVVDRDVRQRLLDTVNAMSSDVRVIRSQLDDMKEQLNGKNHP